MAKYEIRNSENNVLRTINIPESRASIQPLEEGEFLHMVEPDQPRGAGNITKRLEEFADVLSVSGLSIESVTIGDTLENAKNAIDQAAGRARIRYVSQGMLVEQEYAQVKSEVDSWREIGSPLNNIPTMLQSWIDASGLSVEEAATNIETQAEIYKNLLTTTYDIRLKGKKAVNDATGNYRQVAQPFINQLDNL